MDAKITLAFDKDVIKQAKAFAAYNNISLSRLTEYLYKKMISQEYEILDDFPISDWVMELSEGQAEYQATPSRKELKEDFFKSKK
ncbi:MAG: DUF6364 family protein [Chitinophagales bacterium]|nr:DUF6364 family protein [Chitinophagales bacterium]